jgi:hypothetical protein
LFGQERSFPWRLLKKINSKGMKGLTAEPVRIEKAAQGEGSGLCRRY